MAIQRADRPRLQRCREDRIFFGVCSGLGRFFDLDPIFFRLAFVLAVLAGGSGILAYILLAIVMPVDDAASDGSRSALHQNLTDLRTEAGDLTHHLGMGGTTSAATADGFATHRPRDVAATVLILLGVFFLASNLGWLNWFNFGLLWPVLLVLLGIAILSRHADTA